MPQAHNNVAGDLLASFFAGAIDSLNLINRREEGGGVSLLLNHLL